MKRIPTAVRLSLGVSLLSQVVSLIAAPLKVACIGIAPAVRDLAARLGIEVMDYHTRLAGHPEWFPDTVHPNTRGMAVMAAIAFGILQNLPADDTEIRVGASLSATKRPVLAWPTERAVFVLQTATRVDGTNALWTVADAIPATDGSRLLLTNSTASPRFFRLWRP